MKILKNKFLNYVETQKSANQTRMQYGAESPHTHEAYDKANDLKREILNIIESIEE